MTSSPFTFQFLESSHFPTLFPSPTPTSPQNNQQYLINFSTKNHLQSDSTNAIIRESIRDGRPLLVSALPHWALLQGGNTSPSDANEAPTPKMATIQLLNLQNHIIMQKYLIANKCHSVVFNIGMAEGVQDASARDAVVAAIRIVEGPLTSLYQEELTQTNIQLSLQMNAAAEEEGKSHVLPHAQAQDNDTMADFLHIEESTVSRSGVVSSSTANLEEAATRVTNPQFTNAHKDSHHQNGTQLSDTAAIDSPAIHSLRYTMLQTYSLPQIQIMERILSNCAVFDYQQRMVQKVFGTTLASFKERKLQLMNQLYAPLEDAITSTAQKVFPKLLESFSVDLYFSIRDLYARVKDMMMESPPKGMSPVQLLNWSEQRMELMERELDQCECVIEIQRDCLKLLSLLGSSEESSADSRSKKKLFKPLDSEKCLLQLSQLLSQRLELLLTALQNRALDHIQGADAIVQRRREMNRIVTQWISKRIPRMKRRFEEIRTILEKDRDSGDHL